ncbi:hypothetical protein AMATHDRAFT_44914 [Amanita thiersii Skay4041]|uniref:Uncharacterized protein n=1 Tax=Amanita thiersii Skay4041 TaxID=703135 RepID=A0A2A9P071_9AGAR|nr:hypothetical protein AMATHDRAFT_44914 [Amanita thiersii Skay4041]
MLHITISLSSFSTLPLVALTSGHGHATKPPQQKRVGPLLYVLFVLLNGVHSDVNDDRSSGHAPEAPHIPSALPEIPTSTLDFDISAFIGHTTTSIVDAPEKMRYEPMILCREEKYKKRASNLLKLTEEHEKLKAELKAVSDRLEAAERRRDELAKKEQKIMEEPSQ